MDDLRKNKMTYTPELTKEIVEEYLGDPSRVTVSAIAQRVGKPERSIIAKLSSVGVYQAPIRTTKTGDPIIKKEEMAADIGKWLGIDVPSLAKAQKLELRALHLKLQEICGEENVSSE